MNRPEPDQHCINALGKRGRCSGILLAALTFGVAALFALWSVVQSIPDGDVFASNASQAPRSLDALPANDARAIKLKHAALSGRFDVGLFGNSRVVQISAHDLNLGEIRFFNFAIPGTSIRNSLAMLDLLAELRRVPRTVIIGLDNLHLEYFENSEAYFFPERIALLLRDLGWVLGKQIPVTDGVKLVWRHGYMAWRSFESWLTYATQRGRYRKLDSDCPSQYRLDGSRCQAVHHASAKTENLKLAAADPSLLTAVFRRDLMRIKALRERTGSRIILVETPLHPDAVLLGGRASRLRTIFLEECALLELECHGASSIKFTGLASQWPDATHAPAGFLGNWLGEVVLTSAQTP